MPQLEKEKPGYVPCDELALRRPLIIQYCGNDQPTSTLNR
jgi:hypothetical protein